MSDHPFGPAGQHHARTTALVNKMRRRAAELMATDLAACTRADGCPADLHYLECPVHP